MSSLNMLELARELFNKAKAGKLRWQRRLLDDSYAVHFPDTSLAISRRSKLGDVSRDIYRLDLIDGHGFPVASLEAIALSRYAEPGSAAPEEEETPASQILKGIFELARDQLAEGNMEKTLQYLRSA